MPKIEPNKTRQQIRGEERYKKKKIKEAIRMVNDSVKLRLAPSSVHGIGVFTMRDIRKGERLYANVIPCILDIPYSDFGKIRPEIVQMILEKFPRVIDGSKFLAPDTLMQMYLNHNDNPNYDAKTDKALKEIKKGEEVLENYKELESWKVIHKWLS